MSVKNYDLSKGEFPSELDIAVSNLNNDKFRTLLDYVCRILTNDKRISIGYTCLLEFVMIDYGKQDYSFEKIEFFLPEKFTTDQNNFQLMNLVYKKKFLSIMTVFSISIIILI